ncbi:MAG TPA: hypothetical protein VGK18_10960 [Propionicimonas sp.]|jgi:hypothetical protein|uniref:hypothetical protein n=1 Tax=Propionicimonas sp. TaxID=1955623 RepID=UPI002F3EA730
MNTMKLPPAIFESPPLFFAHWLGRHPSDDLPQVIVCLGPSVRDSNAAGHASVLGLKQAMPGKPSTLSRVYAELDGQRLVLYSRGREFLRTGILTITLATVLQWRAEVLLAWVDVPLKDPRTQIPLVGVQHVWTGIAPVDGCDPNILAPQQEELADGVWRASSATEEAPVNAVRTQEAPSPREYAEAPLPAGVAAR